MSGRKRTLKLGWRELWPVWVIFPPPARPKALLAGEDLTLNLADLEPAKIHPPVLVSRYASESG
jgi:hypothetical protein